MEKFWSDDFDMDLLKLFPDLPQLLTETADVKLWTLGHETYGRLNHPVFWNSHGSYVWTYKPDLPRDEHGWVNINGCVCNEPEIECTWMELLRDQWPHSYGFILLPENEYFPAAPRQTFDEIMYHIRGWKPSADIERAMQKAKLWFVTATFHLEDVFDRAEAGCTGSQQ